MRYLAKRDYSAQKIQEKLLQKGFTLSVILPVLEQLRAAKLLDDARFTENFIQNRMNKGQGPKRIAKELAAQGILQTMIAEKMNIFDNAWVVNLRKIWEKKFKKQKPLNYADKIKQTRFLLYRGFSSVQINQLYKNLNLELIDELYEDT